MSNIALEESRDLELLSWLLNLLASKSFSSANVCRGIELFCAAPKKWELPHRFEVFRQEMLGYKDLMRDYGKDVAKGSNVIDGTSDNHLYKTLRDGFAAGDPRMVQYGIKGLLKLRVSNQKKHREDLIAELCRVRSGSLANKFAYEPKAFDTVNALVERRIAVAKDIRYHDINALTDALCGELLVAGRTPPVTRRAIMLKPHVAQPFPLGVIKTIPLYAQDNHTFLGKSLMARFSGELKAGATQTHLDFRWCGAYFGVAYRHLAFQQYGTCDIAWDSVKWPGWLWSHCNSMWY